MLKQRLSNLKTKVHVIDWDKDKTKAKKFLKNQPMPQLIRYHVGSDGRVISGVYFKPSENLNDFVRQQKTILLKTELLEIKKQLERLIKTHGP